MDDSSPLSSAIVICLLIAAFLLYMWREHRRSRFLTAVLHRGWKWNQYPDLAITSGLNLPPFGLLLERSVADHIVGTTASGQRFDAFRYTYGEPYGDGNPRFVVTLALPMPLQSAFAHVGWEGRPSAFGRTFPHRGYEIRCMDAQYDAMLEQTIGPLLERGYHYGDFAGPIDISIDHGHLVMTRIPRDADAIEAGANWLEEVRNALFQNQEQRFIGAAGPAYPSFVNHPWWEYCGNDSTALAEFGFASGFGNEALQVVRSHDPYLTFTRILHHYTEVSVDRNGRTHVSHYYDPKAFFHLKVPFVDLRVNWQARHRGKAIKFESNQFNEKFQVLSPSPKFASDVFSPVMMEFMLRYRVRPFSIENQIILVRESIWGLHELADTEFWLRTFFSHINNFVWAELNVSPHPFPKSNNLGR